jgi:hypothetical protein
VVEGPATVGRSSARGREATPQQGLSRFSRM